MARKQPQIKSVMTAEFMNNETLAAAYGFSVGASFELEFSLVSVENFLFEIVAYAIFVIEQMFDQHKKEVDQIILEQKPHTERWYKQHVLKYQYGFDLIEDTDKFNNAGFTEEQIQNSKIIKYAAVTKTASGLIIKIASESSGVLSPIPPEALMSFDEYIAETADAGVKYLIRNSEPDLLLLNLEIYINPLVLSANGMSIINGNFPVQEALEEYMKELPFNGQMVLAHLIDKLQEVDGVEIPNLLNAQTQEFNKNTEDYDAPIPLNVKTVPESGYFKIPNYDNITYVV